MRSEFSKREFLHLFAAGGVAAATGLLPAGNADARESVPVETFTELAQLLVAVSYLAGFGFVIAGIFKFKQSKQNPSQIPLDLIFAVWAMLDDATASSLTASGYSPRFLLDAVEQAKAGEPCDLLAFFNDLKLLSC